MANLAIPARPVENWEAIRDEWVAEVDRVIVQAETWSGRLGWATLRETKRIVEDRLGAYEVPRLLIHGTFGRALLDPSARFVAGAEGLIDFFAMPSFDGLLLAKWPEGWFLLAEDAEGPRQPWSEEVFAETTPRLVGLS